VRFWDVSGPEIDQLDQQPWSGPFARAMRPVSMRALVQAAIATSMLTFAGGVSMITIVLADRSAVAHPTAAIVVACEILTFAAITLGGLAVFSARTYRRFAPMVVVPSLFFAGVQVTAVVLAGGPQFSIAAGAYLEGTLFAFYLARRPVALLVLTSVLAEFGVVVSAAGWPAPVGQWIALLGTAAVTGYAIGGIAERNEALAASERVARTGLAELNANLEQQVGKQVKEIERLGRLRRFLAPQVVDAVLAGETAALRRPHRQRIAVMFFDLRGFTAFTNTAEPEDVVDVLDAYYSKVGSVLLEHGATIGGYDGDGIMAYIGDPVPRPDAELAVIRMADDLRDELDRLVRRWQNQGYDLGYGVGISSGFATLGVVGFDGRFDYTALGAVVNLAARLCGSAHDGQFLIDRAMYAATATEALCEPAGAIELKGYDRAIPVYELLRARPPRRPRPSPR
jgi:class 3 adenylate cyclase